MIDQRDQSMDRWMVFLQVETKLKPSELTGALVTEQRSESVRIFREVKPHLDSNY